MKYFEYILITRLIKGENETIGFLSYIPKEGDIISLFTLELPWKDNKNEISCIPENTYKYKKWFSPTFKTTVIRLYNVPNRENILIHPANFVRELKGCIAPGLTRRDIDKDGKMDVSISRNALKKLIAKIPEKGFIKINSI